MIINMPPLGLYNSKKRREITITISNTTLYGFSVGNNSLGQCRSLRQYFDAMYPGISPSNKTIKINIINGGILGGVRLRTSGNDTDQKPAGQEPASLTIGDWPTATHIIVAIAPGCYIVGAGGNCNLAGGPGGTALYTRRPITLINQGIIGGGGGGGAMNTPPGVPSGAGAGGAGAPSGTKGTPWTIHAAPTLTKGGIGGPKNAPTGRGDGGDLGKPGTQGAYIYGSLPGGVAGYAIDGWSYVTLDSSSTGDILGEKIN